MVVATFVGKCSFSNSKNKKNAVFKALIGFLKRVYKKRGNPATPTNQKRVLV